MFLIAIVEVAVNGAIEIQICAGKRAVYGSGDVKGRDSGLAPDHFTRRLPEPHSSVLSPCLKMIDFAGLYALCVSHFLMLFRRVFVPTATLGVGVLSAPSGFPATGNGLWYTTAAGAWSKSWLPIGNGYLAAMVPGGTRVEVTQLNIESLWSGGPFADPVCRGYCTPNLFLVISCELMVVDV